MLRWWLDGLRFGELTVALAPAQPRQIYGAYLRFLWYAIAVLAGAGRGRGFIGLAGVRRGCASRWARLAEIAGTLSAWVGLYVVVMLGYSDASIRRPCGSRCGVTAWTPLEIARRRRARPGQGHRRTQLARSAKAWPTPSMWAEFEPRLSRDGDRHRHLFRRHDQRAPRGCGRGRARGAAHPRAPTAR